MFGIFKKKEPPGRKEVREEFEKFTTALRHAENTIQMAVGHSINMANSIFANGLGVSMNFADSPLARGLSTFRA